MTLVRFLGLVVLLNVARYWRAPHFGTTTYVRPYRLDDIHGHLPANHGVNHED